MRTDVIKCDGFQEKLGCIGACGVLRKCEKFKISWKKYRDIGHNISWRKQGSLVSMLFKCVFLLREASCKTLNIDSGWKWCHSDVLLTGQSQVTAVDHTVKTSSLIRDVDKAIGIHPMWKLLLLKGCVIFFQMFISEKKKKKRRTTTKIKQGFLLFLNTVTKRRQI